MKNFLIPGIFFLVLMALPSCKKERCLKCTTEVNGIATDQPELCDTDKDLLDAKEAEYEALVADFVNDGWDASISCTRQ